MQPEEIVKLRDELQRLQQSLDSMQETVEELKRLQLEIQQSEELIFSSLIYIEYLHFKQRLWQCFAW